MAGSDDQAAARVARLETLPFSPRRRALLLAAFFGVARGAACRGGPA